MESPEKGLQAELESDLTTGVVVLESGPRQQNPTPREPVVSGEVWFVELGHPIAPILEVDLVFPEAHTAFGDEPGFRMAPARAPFAPRGHKQKSATLLRRHQGDASLVVDEVTVGVDEVLEQPRFPHVRSSLEAVVCAEAPAGCSGPPDADADRVGQAESIGQGTGWGLTADMQNQLRARTGAGLGRRILSQIRRGPCGKQDEEKGQGAHVQRGKLRPTRNPLSNSPPLSWAMKIQSSYS